MERLILVGTGSGNPSAETVRNCASIASKQLRQMGVTKIVFDRNLGDTQSIAEGAILGLYRFDELRSAQGTWNKNPSSKNQVHE